MLQTLARFAAAIALLAAALPAAAQVIEISPRSYDFGRMKQQETRNTFFTVTNKGAGLLVIEDIVASCGCTIPTIHTKQLGPGESTQVEVQFDSKRFDGHVVKTVDITSNDTINPVVTFMVTADVEAKLLVDPSSQRLGFERVAVGTVQRDTVILTGTDKAVPLEVRAGGTMQGIWDVRVIDSFEGDASRAAVELTLPAGAPAGRLRDNLRITTNIPEYETVDIGLAGWRTYALTMSPEEVNFRFKTTLFQRVRISPTEKGTEFKITGAEIDLPEITVSVEETIPNYESFVRLEGRALPSTDPRCVESKGRISGTLTIYTDLPELPSLTVPVRYMVRM